MESKASRFASRRSRIGPDRRQTLALMLAGLGAATGTLAPERARADTPEFDFQSLVAEARALAAADHVPLPPAAGDLADDYDSHRAIRVREETARWRDAGAMRVLPHPVGWLFDTAVPIFDVSDGTLQPMDFGTDDFVLSGPAAGVEVPGAAGFRLTAPLNRPDKWDEVASFLGASYFRALGRGNAYGLSARGLAVDTARGGPEEFPVFRAFYLARGGEGGAVATVMALLDGPSVTGAYRIAITPGAETVMDVSARLFFRKAVGELGVAPLTSMFLLSPADRVGTDDHRPRVHDSDGLMIDRADGDRIWRPLVNPPRLATSYFAETAPRGFGLYQRARGADDFEDPGAAYHRRPSLRVEPLGDWGAGHVRLVEIPTEIEATDNIVAFWVPSQAVTAGEARAYDYRLIWGDLPPDPAGDLAHVVQTRTGRGGVAGLPAPEGQRKFVVDFEGGPLVPLGPEAGVEAVLGAFDGEIVEQGLYRLEDGRWRLVLDVAAEPGAVVELSAHLAGEGRKLSEIWLYQWVVA